MKVLLINSGHSRGGGAFTVYLNTADMLRKKGIEVVFFSIHSSRELPCEQSNYFAKEVKEHPDVAHAHLIWGGLAPSILDVLKRNHIPIVHTVHDYAMVCSLATMRGTDGKECDRCKDGKYFESLRTKCHKGSLIRSIIATAELASRNMYHHPVDLIDHFMFVSQFAASKHAQMDARFKEAPQSVMYNVPDEYFLEKAAEKEPDTYNSYYLYYGRLSYEKGLKTLLEVFARHPKLTLKVVGTGPLEKELREKYEGMSANGSTRAAGQGYENIQFLGFHSGEALAELVQSARFVCIPSEWYENNPMTIVESYTLSTPVIASRIGGIPEIVNEGQTGFLFESASKEDLELALQKSLELTATEYRKMKVCAQEYAYFKFERGKYVERLLNLYREVIKNK